MLQKNKELGFLGINFDLMYGLPLQTISSFGRTIESVIQMRPDRIALYNYARLPAMIPHQKILEKYNMPSADDRVEIFSYAYEKFLDKGYRAIGMDHFALETDELYQSIHRGSLYRNFMGYTVQKSPSMIGLGASAIGELPTSFFQNIREPAAYQQLVDENSWAVMRGCLLTDEDLIRKKIIQSIFCRFRVSYEDFDKEFGISFKEKFAEEIKSLKGFIEEGILEEGKSGFSVTPLGRLFVRNVAMVFDEYLKKPPKVQYSTTV
jgi:oxygen-independent coproporphyrinogen-3 oxidase